MIRPSLHKYHLETKSLQRTQSLPKSFETNEAKELTLIRGISKALRPFRVDDPL